MSGIVKQQMLIAGTGGGSQALSISTTSAQSAAITTGSVNIYSTVDCFVRQGTSPTATSDGTDQFIPGGLLIRISGIKSGSKLAFKALQTGTVYITPEA